MVSETDEQARVTRLGAGKFVSRRVMAGICGATVCTELSIRSAHPNGDKSALGARVCFVGGCLRSGPCLGRVLAFSSGNFSKADFSQPKFRTLVSTMEGNRIGYVIMGSFSHFNHGCVRANDCVRGIFPFVKMEFVSVGSSCSDSGPTSEGGRFSGSVGRLYGRRITESVSGGMGSAFGAGERGNRFVNACTPRKCLGSPRSGRGLVVSPRATPMVLEVFRVHTDKVACNNVTSALGVRNVRDPITCEVHGKVSERGLPRGNNV